MNFLSRACLSSKGHPAYWRVSCSCRDAEDVTVPLSSNKKHSKINQCGQSSLQRNACYNSLTLVGRPVMWSQIRLSKFPRFHRDLEYPSFDDYRKNQFVDVRKTSWGQADDKPGHSYTLAFAGGCAGLYAAKSIVTYLISFMSAAADVLALASIEVDLAKIEPGACDIVKWRGKPLFIKHRTQADIDLEKATAVSSLRDPEGEEVRTQKPEWLIIIGICTHLGCVPIANVGDFPGGFYCPCHGSHYDNLGRIRKGPAPLNMVVPPYKFVTDSQVVIG